MIRRFISFFTMENLLILGTLFLIISSVWAFRNAVVLHRGLNTSGIITDVRPTSDDERPFYKTTFAFHVRDGQSYTVTQDFEERPASHKRGDNVAVVYNPTNPYDASLCSYNDMWYLPVCFGSVGAIMLAIGLTLWRRKLSKQAVRFRTSSASTNRA
jgi:hypothetical protein